jgi:hypothetical protein
MWPESSAKNLRKNERVLRQDITTKDMLPVTYFLKLNPISEFLESPQISPPSRNQSSIHKPFGGDISYINHNISPTVIGFCVT